MGLLERVVAEPEEPVARPRERAALVERLRRDVVERMGAPAVAGLVRSAETARAAEELGAACEAVLSGDGYRNVPTAERGALVREVLDQVLGLGALQPLMDDPGVTEVMVNGTGSLFYEKNGALHPTARVFDNRDQILRVVDRILAPLGRRLDESSPIVNARLASGDRVNAVIDPVAVDGPYVTIRRFTGRIRSLDRLVELGAMPVWLAQLLSWAVKARQAIAVAGGTGSGKTTLLNALSHEIPASERVITIEDSAELSFKGHPHVVRLEARAASIEGTGEVTIRQLVTNALRMRPDRIVVGEVRGAEAVDMLQAMNTGHDGSLTTLHAGTEREAVSRLVLMARLGMDLPASLLEEQVATALDLMVMAKRLPDGARRVTTVSAVERDEGGRARLVPLVDYDEPNDAWRLVREPEFVGRLPALRIAAEGEVQRWRTSCG